MREQRAQAWAKRAPGWRESGETQMQYCADHGLSVWALRNSSIGLRIARRSLMLSLV